MKLKSLNINQIENSVDSCAFSAELVLYGLEAPDVDRYSTIDRWWLFL